MEEKKSEKTSKQQISMLSIILAVTSGFISAFFTLPGTGLASTIPVSVILSALCALFVKEKWMISLSAGGMAAFFNSVYGFGTVRAVFMFFVCAVIAFFSALLVQALKTADYAKKNGDAERRKKAVCTVVLSAVLVAAVFVLFFGNLFSGLYHKSKNIDYVKENYQNVGTSYTYYDFSERAYLTRVNFAEAEKAGNYYVSAGKKDDYYGFCIEKLAFSAKDYFEKSTSLSGDFVECIIDAENKNVSENSGFEDFKDKTSYVFNMEDVMVDFAGFKKVCEKYSEYFGLSENFTYKNIVINAQGLKEQRYKAEFSPDGSVTYSINSD
ncbi:MAG: MFS transporter [Clostridiales bacterium]|nr:MFS transporter [Clostridiales bacterium]